ncbi:hypothetical protein QBC46DRAFT_408281 [Diplogelasinospora grovesii]|uniref:Uncharacterized protein n=1 Tax=Diplogelasinospora grovesii TaxID=303347 RepID=A0AAN6N8N0_9PEZI|nr:hypothetical protein QBC46DRAFT_408281 [Diplogelasinospora grovesii]
MEDMEVLSYMEALSFYTEVPQDLKDIRRAGRLCTAAVVNTLAVNGIPSAIVGDNALSADRQQDIELVVNEAAQEQCYEVLTSCGLIPGVPEGTAAPGSFADWQWRAQTPPSRHPQGDRRRYRLATPMYAIPSTVWDWYLPWIIIYSAEDVHLPPILQLPSSPPITSGPYVSVCSVYSSPDYCRFRTEEDLQDAHCLVPSFRHFVESALYVSMVRDEIDPSISAASWAYEDLLRMLLKCRSHCPGGMASLPDLALPVLQKSN